MRKTAFWAAVGVTLIAVLGTATFALAHGFGKDLKAKDMTGYNEAPAVSSAATGDFRAKIDDKADKIDYTESYSGLEGDVTQSHIHFGQRNVSGGIMVWLCQTATNPAPAAVAATTPQCPGPRAGTVSGTLTPASIVGPAGQGIVTGEWNELLAAIRTGNAYANVHSSKFPGGEIRAQVNDGGKGHGFGRGDH